MKKRFLTREPLRWFLLLWVGMAVTGSLIGSNAQDGSFIGRNVQNTIPSGVYVVTVSPPPAASINLPPIKQWQGGLFVKPTLPLSSTLLFLLLVALYSFLLWRGLSGRVSPRFFWLYFLFQGLLVLAMH